MEHRFVPVRRSMVLCSGSVAVSCRFSIAPGEDEEMYVFTDNTGSIDVVIDEEDMEGLNIGANDIVIIEGEIDQNGDNIEVDVEEITLAQ